MHDMCLKSCDNLAVTDAMACVWAGVVVCYVLDGEVGVWCVFCGGCVSEVVVVLGDGADSWWPGLGLGDDDNDDFFS